MKFKKYRDNNKEQMNTKLLSVLHYVKRVYTMLFIIFFQRLKMIK